MTIKRVLFLGMPGVFSLPPLAALLTPEAAWSVVGVVIPRSTADDGPAATPAPAGDSGAAHIIQLASKHNRPVFSVGRLASAEAVLADLRPDLIVVACFSRLLPRSWLTFPVAGCLNIHPSLLPAYRGPTPLFWQLHAGEQRTGVTIHLLNEKMDAGDIVAQQPVRLPPGAREAALEQLLASAGAALLPGILRQWPLPRRPQDPAQATYQPFPTATALEISSDWGVVRAYNFIRGMRRYGPFRLQDATGAVQAVDALGVAADPGAAAPGTRWVTFGDGALQVRLAAESAGGGET